VIERARGALVDRERLDGQQAFVELRRAAGTSRRELPDGAGDMAVGLPGRKGDPTRQGRLWTVRSSWT
jgi:hypothetical protein